MSKTYIADKDTLDAVNGKIGTKNDAPSPNPISLFAGIKQLLKGLSDHMASWTGDRAVKVDYLDTTVGSRAPANTALSTTQWTNARAGYLDKLNNSSYGLEAIKNAANKKAIGSAIGIISKELNEETTFSGTGKGILFIYGQTNGVVNIDGKDIGTPAYLANSNNVHINYSIEFSKSFLLNIENKDSYTMTCLAVAVFY